MSESLLGQMSDKSKLYPDYHFTMRGKGVEIRQRGYATRVFRPEELSDEMDKSLYDLARYVVLQKAWDFLSLASE